MSITLEDARQWRAGVGAPIDWLDDIPRPQRWRFGGPSLSLDWKWCGGRPPEILHDAPPFSRVEFTFFVLRTALTCGFPLPDWDKPIESDLRHDIETFQRTVHTYAPGQSYSGFPELQWDSPVVQDASIHRPLTWGEYFEALERDYYYPWMTGRRFGSDGGSERVLILMAWLLSPDGLLKTEEIQTWGHPLDARETVRKRCPIERASQFENYLNSLTATDIPLAEQIHPERWQTVCIVFALALAIAIPACLIVGGALGQWSYLWLLTVPLAWIALGISTVFLIITRLPYHRWIEQNLTLGELADRIAAANQKRWAVDIETYTRRPDLYTPTSQ